MYIKVDNRRFQRVGLSGDIAIFVDYGCYYKGEVKDVSYDGFRVDFPSISSRSIFWPNFSIFFSATIWRVRKFRIIICTNILKDNEKTEDLPFRIGKSFLVFAYPRWMKKKESHLEIGFKIPESSVGWQFFVHQKLTEKE
ncbi:MAG: hypothetical protein D3904_01850 [Candidatus Electrothrix sp. EH2]|nr:hypothetical protein [Candidatus Electrothrix sp. EH2]